MRTFGTTQITEPLDLLVGNYKLTEFLVLDVDGNVIAATPKEGSEMAKFVQNPLDISFSLTKDEVKKIVPEVVSTERKVPEDFGYVTFSFDEVEIIQFLLATFIYDDTTQSFKLTDATIEIKGDNEVVYKGTLEAITNEIIIKNNHYSQYELTVSKAGYKTDTKYYTEQELKANFSKPITIILEKGTLEHKLLLYIPFNGDIKDESVFNRDLKIINGPTLSKDRHGNSNRAIYFEKDKLQTIQTAADSLFAKVDLNDGFSVSFWMRSMSSKSFNYVVTIGSWMSSLGWYDILNFEEPSKNKFKIFTNLSKVVSSGIYTKYDDVWMHITIVWSSKNKKYTVYRGENVILELTNADLDFSKLSEYKAAFRLSKSSGGTNYSYEGYMDEVRFYGRQLSLEEIKVLSQQ